jgi:hypothetical protein
MDISELRSCYRLQPITAHPANFLLDPHNPRIALLLGGDAGEVAPEAVASEVVQKAVFNILNRPEFELRQLVTSIRSRGFVADGSHMIVKRVEGGLLVLEGNRRTAAIKTLLKEPSLLSSAVRASLSVITVEELHLNDVASVRHERDIVEMILGQIHVSGKLSWGAMERANYMYASYCRIAALPSGKLDGFRYDSQAAQRVAETFDTSVKDVRKNLMIARNFMLLSQTGAAVLPSHFSLLELAVTNRAVNEYVFELSKEEFHFSQQGADRFAVLCIDQDHIIRNPQDFRAFAKVCATQNEKLITEVYLGSVALEDAVESLEQEKQRNVFATSLTAAIESLNEIPLAAFNGDDDSKQLIQRLKGVVSARFEPLLKE